MEAHHLMADLHGDTITAAPAPVLCHRDDDCAASQQRLRSAASSSVASSLQRLRSACDSMACCLVGALCNVPSSLVGLGNSENCHFCLLSCLYLFFCEAFATLLLHVFCCRCLTFLLRRPEFIDPANFTQRVFFFCSKQLSNLWVSAMICYVASSIVFRPWDLKPLLGACTVYEFELQSPASQAAPGLCFNITTYILFKNTGQTNMHYNHLAVAVFYADEKLGPADDELRSFDLEISQSTVREQVVMGRLRNTSCSVAKTFVRERVQGRFEIVVRIRATLTYKFWPFKAVYFVMYDCPLSSPVPKINEPAVTSPAWCKVIKI